MERYITTIILRPEVNTELFKKFIFNNKYVTILDYIEIGRKKLAYSIRSTQEGFFIEINFRSTEKRMHEFEQLLGTRNEILKFMTLFDFNY